MRWQGLSRRMLAKRNAFCDFENNTVVQLVPANTEGGEIETSAHMQRELRA